MEPAPERARYPGVLNTYLALAISSNGLVLPRIGVGITVNVKCKSLGKRMFCNIFKNVFIIGQSEICVPYIYI